MEGRSRVGSRGGGGGGGSRGGLEGLLSSHAVTKVGLWRLGVAWSRCVAVAVGLLGGHGYGHVGPRCEHELWRACNTDATKESKYQGFYFERF